jgi:hypothetical protein
MTIARHMENNAESDAPINPKYLVAGYNIIKKKIVLSNDAVLYLSGLPIAKITFMLRIDNI